jgi:site-specific DNA-methyltransferase (adenine-specific)
MNQLIHGDCLHVVSTILPNTVDLVYCDPPFFTQKTHTQKTRDNTYNYSFDDKWDTLSHYVQFLRERLIAIRQVMKPTATIFFHCDRTASHHIRFVLDEVFGSDQFQSEIIWFYKRWSNAKRGLLNAHQTIFMYSKTSDFKFNTLYQDYSETTNLDQILQKRQRDTEGKTTYALDNDGAVVLNGVKKGVPLTDVWEIPYLNPKANERVGYPTQKPILLLERIINIVTDPHDVVLDPFCGSGSTLVASHLLDRSYIGIDTSQDAIKLAQKRLSNPIRTTSHVLIEGRESYDALPVDVKRILDGLPVKIVQRNQGIDALYDTFIDGCPIVIRVQRPHESLYDVAQKLLKAGKSKRATTMILVQTKPSYQSTLLKFEEELPNEIIVVQSLALALAEIVAQQKEQN